MSNLVRQMSYKIIPGREQSLKVLCGKFQAMMDRNNNIFGSKRDPTFSEDITFYSMIIPDIKKKTEHLIGKDEVEQKIGLSTIINAWVKENGGKCTEYLEISGKAKLRDKRQRFEKIKQDTIEEIDNYSDDYIKRRPTLVQQGGAKKTKKKVVQRKKKITK